MNATMPGANSLPKCEQNQNKQIFDARPYVMHTLVRDTGVPLTSSIGMVTARRLVKFLSLNTNSYNSLRLYMNISVINSIDSLFYFIIYRVIGNNSTD